MIRDRPSICVECSIPLTTQVKWQALSASVRREHTKNRTLACHKARGTCSRCHSRLQRAEAPPPPRSTRSNAETRAIFDEHDPGPSHSNTARLRIAALAAGINPSTMRSAAENGRWDLGHEHRVAGWPEHEIALTGGSWQKHPTSPTQIFVKDRTAS